jgi:hypothetical protein
MFNLIIGTVLVLITAAMYVWMLPPDDQPSRWLDRWGLRTLFPIFITCLGVAGALLIAKSILS